MSGVSVDHVVSIIILLAAVVLFIGLFNQTLSVALNYQHNTSTAKECDNLLDEMLLTTAPPISGSPAWFGLQGSTLPAYNLDPFCLMRLSSSAGTPISYQKTGQTYSTIRTNPNNCLDYPYSDMINYSTALNLLGLRGTYSFQLTFTPTVNVSVTQTSSSPLTFVLNARGTGFPLAQAQVNCLLIPIDFTSSCPQFGTPIAQTSITNSAGSTSPIVFASSSPGFVFVAYAYLDGISGIGYCVSSPVGTESIVPFVNPLSQSSVTLADSNDVPATSSSPSTLLYNSSFILESQNYAFQQTPMGNGSVTSGHDSNSPVHITMGGYTPGIVVVAYKNADNSGVALVPWGLSSLGFSLTFGNSPINQSWIATDMRQVQINSVSYQVTLSLWSTQSYSGVG